MKVYTATVYEKPLGEFTAEAKAVGVNTLEELWAALAALGDASESHAWVEVQYRNEEERSTATVTLTVED